MATSNRRDVTLGIGIETAGEDDIRRLATDVRAFAKAGGDAAPEYAKLAAQLDRLADEASGLAGLRELAQDTNRLAAEQSAAAAAAADLAGDLAAQSEAVDRARARQAEARAEVDRVVDGLAAQRRELRALTADIRESGDATAAQAARQKELRASIEDYRSALTEARRLLRDSTSDATAAARVERTLSSEYERASRAAVASTGALRARNTALQETKAALETAGANVDNLTDAESRLNAALKEAVGGLAATRAAQVREQAEADRLAAIEARGRAEALRDGEDAARAELAAIRESGQFMRQYAAEQAAAAEAARKKAEAERAAAAAAEVLAAKRREQAEADRLATLQAFALREAQREGTAAAQAEIAAIRESEQFMRQYAAAKQEAARAETAALALAEKRREQAEADRLAAVEARGLADAQRAAAAAAASELAAIRESEQFMRQYAVSARQAGVATGALAADAQELATAFGTTGLRSMQAIEAEIRRVNAALGTLQAQQRAGAISAQDLARATSSAGARLQQLRTEIDRVPEARGAFEQMGAQVNSLVGRFGALTATVAVAAQAFRPLLNATIQLEQMRRALTTVTGSSAEAARQIEFVRDVSQRAGQSVSATGESFSKFAASAVGAGLSMDVVQRTFSAVALASGNLGLSSDQAKRALEALSQMASKGTVSMEELRQQLGDALPGVLSSLARELGLTEQQLIKLVESGGLLASEALPALASGLASLGPQSGKVEGLVAEFNRLKNVVLEAGTTLTDGALGRAAGAALGALSEAVQRVAFGAAMIGEAFSVTGQQIGTVVAAIVSRDFTSLGASLAQIEKESNDRLGALAERILGVGGASEGAAASARKAAVESKAAAEASGAAATAAARSTPAIAGQAAALARVSESATAAAGAVREMASTALPAVSTALVETAKSYSQLVVRHEEQLRQADLSAAALGKHAEAVKSAGEATVRAISIAGDDVAVKQAQAQAAANTAQALSAVSAADQAYADMLARSRDIRAQRLLDEGKTAAAVRDATRALDEKILKADAEAAKSRAAAETAAAKAAARSTLTKALADNSGAYDSLTRLVEAARGELQRLQVLQDAGLATTTEVTAATLRLAEAYALQRDALRDATRNLELNLQAERARTAAAAANLTVREAEAQATERVARLTGDATTAAQAEVRVKELQAERVRETAAQKVREAEASIQVLQAQRAEFAGEGDVLAAKRREIDIRIETERAKVREAEASKYVVQGIEAEIKALRDRNAAVAGSLSSSFDQSKDAARSTVGGATYDNQGFSTNSDGSRVTGSGQLKPPDASGDWEFVNNAANPEAFSPYYVPRVGYWRRKSGPTSGFGAGPVNTAGSAPAYGNQPAPGPSAAPSASSPSSATRLVRVEIAGRTTEVNVASEADADTLEAMLRGLAEAAART